MARRARRGGVSHQYPRTARLNELLREIVGEQLERIDDHRLDLVTVVSVETDPEMRVATVYFDSLAGADGDEQVLEALAAHRVRLQRAIGAQARTKRVPVLSFAPDPGIRAGERIDTLLRGLGDDSNDSDDGGGDGERDDSDDRGGDGGEGGREPGGDGATNGGGGDGGRSGGSVPGAT